MVNVIHLQQSVHTVLLGILWAVVTTSAKLAHNERLLNSATRDEGSQNKKCTSAPIRKLWVEEII